MLRRILSRKSKGAKTIRFVFNASPDRIDGDGDGDGDGVTALSTTRNKVYLDSNNQLKVEPTGAKQTINAQMIINATGYQGRAMEGLRFDASRGVIANRDGRALLENGNVAEKEYVAGWIKRGASGVIGTNKQCAVSTVKTLLKDSQEAARNRAGAPESTIEDILNRNKVTYFDFSDWQALDNYERQRGGVRGRPRCKVVDVDEILAVKAANQRAISAKASEPDLATKSSVKAYDASQPVKIHYRTCSLCEAMCGIKVEYQGERIISMHVGSVKTL